MSFKRSSSSRAIPEPITTAVKGLCVLLLNAAGQEAKDAGVEESTVADEPGIFGGRGTLAASLDYAIDKNTSWLSDMFGTDAEGKSLIRRLIDRINPSRKREGPVIIRWRRQSLPYDQIKVFLDGTPLDSRLALHSLALQIEKH